MVRCKIYSIIERRDKLLVPKLDYLVKRLGSKKCIVAKNGIVVGEYFTCPTIQHIKNERLYGYIGQNTIATQVANQGKAKQNTKYLQFRIYSKRLFNDKL
jgi:hypothetical protein